MTEKVNGEEEDSLWEFATTESCKISGTHTQDLTLKEGVNTIELRVADEDHEGHINVDSLAVDTSVERWEGIAADEHYEMLFDGTIESFEDWNMAGDGAFGITTDCELLTYGGMGLLWHSE